MTALALSPEEDATLRRLVFFEGAGIALAPPLRVLRQELRARDRRLAVREPEITVRRVADYS
jgi:hypothetical protein